MTSKPGRTTGAAKSKSMGKLNRNVVPDRLDLRDRYYAPPVEVIPDRQLLTRLEIPVLDQGETGACTGFALATVIYCLMRRAGHAEARPSVSPFMLYSMARRYDEFPGDPDIDTGSSLRGAMKGWYKHGVCSSDLWKSEEMPTGPFKSPSKDWWLDAARRPLGAYYRIDTRSVTDMHVAVNQVGALYASAVCHSGWDEGFDPGADADRWVTVNRRKIWVIPPRKAKFSDGGHAIAIIGYTSRGFVIQNSWSEDWGAGGLAVLTYEDWLDNAMDCWVAQLGVVTESHRNLAKSSALRVTEGKVELAPVTSLRNRELGPFIIDMENNGILSNSGDFRTQPSDVTALVTEHLGRAREEWKLNESDPVDIAIYAHGGLTSEDGAAKTAAKWIPALYENHIFPIFLMWETDLKSTLINRAKDWLKGQPRYTSGLMDRISSWWNERLEQLLRVAGTAVWSEMKQNADAITDGDYDAGEGPEKGTPGGIMLFRACQASQHFSDRSKVKIHVIGHSAGSILHCHLVKRFAENGWRFESANFMAPAVKIDTFEETILPLIRDGRNGRVKRLNEFHLTDEKEQEDPTCKPILGYSRSLLYLVSGSFEKKRNAPILGMEKFYREHIRTLKLKNVNTYLSPGSDTQSTTHGGFDDDTATRECIIRLIRGSR